MEQTLEKDQYAELRSQIEAEVREKIKAEEAEKKKKRAKKTKNPKIVPTWEEVWKEAVWERTYDHLGKDERYDEWLDQLEKTNQLYTDFETHTPLAVRPVEVMETIAEEKNWKNWKGILNNIRIEITGYDNKGENKENKGYPLDALKGKIRLVQLGDKKDTFIFDRYKCTKEQWERIGNLFRDRLMISHNGIFECRYICKEWSPNHLPFHMYDTMVVEKLIMCSKLAFLGATRLDLGSTAERRAGIYIEKGYGGSDWGNPDLSPEQMKYAAEDVDIMRPIVKAQLPELKNLGNNFVQLERDVVKELDFLSPLRKLHVIAAIECDVIPVFARMMHIGVPINREFLEKEVKERDAKIEEYNSKWGFNLASPKQTLPVLVNQYQLNVDATNADVLAPYYGKNELVTDILDSNSIGTIKGLLEGLLEAADKYGDNRVHTKFTVYQAYSGRTASRYPNIQQIPREIKPYWMMPPTSKTIINLDLPAIEMRIMAKFCKEKKMLDAFLHGKDLHKITAAAVNKVPIEEVSKDMRKKAKAVNFGFLYGCSPKRFKQTAMTKYQLDYSIEECTNIRETFFKSYPDLDRHVRRMFKLFPYGRKDIRYIVKTFLGRKMMADSSGNALNYSIQGSCADCVKLAMIYFNHKLRTFKEGKYSNGQIELISMVHDELFCESDVNCMKFATRLVKKAMEIGINYIMIDSFPVQVEPEFGDFKGNSWKEKYSDEELQAFIDELNSTVYTIHGQVEPIKPAA
jgi:DNA polymerase-1